MSTCQLWLWNECLPWWNMPVLPPILPGFVDKQMEIYLENNKSMWCPWDTEFVHCGSNWIQHPGDRHDCMVSKTHYEAYFFLHLWKRGEKTVVFAVFSQLSRRLISGPAAYFYLNLFLRATLQTYRLLTLQSWYKTTIHSETVQWSVVAPDYCNHNLCMPDVAPSLSAH